jgi:hypothetical protein
LLPVQHRESDAQLRGLVLHQRWACEHAGFRRHDASDVTHLIDTLLSDSSVTLDRSVDSDSLKL